MPLTFPLTQHLVFTLAGCVSQDMPARLCSSWSPTACLVVVPLPAVVVFGFFVTVDGQTIAWSAGSPSLVYTYDWTITKSVGSGNAGSGSTAITVS
jgi:hypothetical protein